MRDLQPCMGVDIDHRQGQLPQLTHPLPPVHADWPLADPGTVDTVDKQFGNVLFFLP